MTITVTTQARQAGVPHMTVQSFTSDGSAATLTFGFKPSRVTVYNETDTIQWVWVKGMASTKVVKYNGTGPAITTDTGTAILDNGDGTITISSGAAGTSKVIIVVAEA
jgi:hypothetical protein